MKRGICYFIGLIIISVSLFWIASNLFHFHTNTLIAFFLAMIVSHLILEKNQWLIDAYKASLDNTFEQNKAEK